MSGVDPIQRIAPAIQPPSAAQHVSTSSWQGGRQHQDAPEDKVELHEAAEDEAAEVEIQDEPEVDGDHGLDIAV